MWIKFLLLSVPSLVTGPCEVKRHWLTNHPFFSLFLEVKLMITFSNVMEMLPFLELWLYVYLQTQNVSNIFHQWKKNTNIIQTSSEHIQFSSVAQVVSDSLRPHESQHARPPCPSATPGVHPNSCPPSRWCHPPTIIPFSSCPQPAQHQSLFQWVNSSHEVAKVLELQL